MSNWILQANPSIYDISSALRSRPVIYWRIPQYTEQLRAEDRVLMWRAGKEAGFVGWGVILSDPEHYDLTEYADPHIKPAFPRDPTECYAPVRVWPGEEIAKAQVAAALPEHRIITAPMGTVFPLAVEDVAALQPILVEHGYDLTRAPDVDFTPLPVVQIAEPEASTRSTPSPQAKITPALFLLSSSPDEPVEITIEGDALRMHLLERGGLKTADETWDAVGIYLLIGDPITPAATLSVYVGKAQGLRSRVRTGHVAKEWRRCLLIQREGLHAFNASDISWLERRLIDVLLEAPSIDLVNKTPPPPEAVPPYKAEILERTVIAPLGVIGVLGAYTA